MGNVGSGQWLTDIGAAGGPMRTGTPDKPKYGAYATDPTQFNVASRQGLVRDQQTQAGLAGTRKMNQLQARLGGAAGGLRRSDYGAQLGEIGADTERAQNSIALEAQQKEWDDQMRLMDAYNKAIEAANTRTESQYKTDVGLNQAERAQRQAWLNSEREKLYESGTDVGKFFMGAGIKGS